MCRLLAIMSDVLDAENILDKFRALSESGDVPDGAPPGHRDGWGMAGYRDGRLEPIERSTESALKDPKYGEASLRAVSEKLNPIIVHLRKASRGEKAPENTHPFKSDNFVFAHNGTIDGGIVGGEAFGEPREGNTDSERFFSYIMQLYRNGRDNSAAGMRSAIMAAVNSIKKGNEYSAMNFLLSDGECVWALREAVKWENYYALHTGSRDGKRIQLICSEQLDLPGIKWDEMPNHELLEYGIGDGASRRSPVNNPA